MYITHIFLASSLPTSWPLSFSFFCFGAPLIEFWMLISFWVWSHALEHGWSTSNHTLKEFGSTSPQKPSVANSSSARDVDRWAPHTGMEYWFIWSCPCNRSSCEFRNAPVSTAQKFFQLLIPCLSLLSKLRLQSWPTRLSFLICCAFEAFPSTTERYSQAAEGVHLVWNAFQSTYITWLCWYRDEHSHSSGGTPPLLSRIQLLTPTAPLTQQHVNMWGCLSCPVPGSSWCC